MDRRTLLATGGAAFALGITTPRLIMAQEADNEFGIMDMVQGSADAPVEMIEYASYTCPHCARFHADTYPELKADYIDSGKVRFVYREVYFDRFGLWASMVARCGGQEKFFGITDLIYEKQREWTESGDPAIIAEELNKIGLMAGLDAETLDACMSDGEMAQNLVDWYRANAERDDVSSTPSFLIDGQKYSNMAYADLKAILDDKIGA
ncbi:DsbA family protein [Yoonia sp. 208BN28-4]|uniref:DsbA family protein n=1 Tax=Yoonia sp. 208BN28-4 TaxID=3126505 RepID=UPI0030A45273